MSTTNEKIISTVEYIVESPFVQKVLTNSNKKDLEYADAIHKMSSKLAGVKLEHEKALDVVREAAKEPENYFEIIKENSGNITAKYDNEYNEEKNKFDAMPKVDEEYVHTCKNKIEKLKEERQETEKAIIDDVAKEEKKSKKYLITGILLAILCFCDTIILLAYMGSLSSSVMGLLYLIFLITIIASPIILSMAGMKNYRKKQNDKLSENNNRIDGEIKALNQEIERGFKENSEFHLNILRAEIAVLEAKQKKLNAESKHLLRIELSQNGFETAISVLENTVLNFDSLNNWAANYIQDYKQEQYNKKLYDVEIEKLKEQKLASEAQKDAFKRQNELLEEQVRAAVAAQQAAEKQAKDTEKIERRMYNEGYGEYYNPNF